MRVVIVGGGAAGFFAAIACAEAAPKARVTIVERGASVLQKVKISGGGRCNVTHACFDARELTRFYPRGGRELTGPFMRFGPSETVEWFAQRGVRLKTEADGRMFPVTDDSQTIVSCLWEAAQRAGVDVLTGARAERIEALEKAWKIHLTRREPLDADCLMLATGSSESVWEMLTEMGYPIVQPVPSLFTFNTKDTRLKDLAGVSVPDVEIEISGSRHRARGPVLITHWGLSGPGILRLSAWAARELHAADYRFQLKINWTGNFTPDEIVEQLKSFRQSDPKKQIAAHARLGLPQRLWERLCAASDVGDMRWADAGNKPLQALAQQLAAGVFAIHGKSTFKEEFVTAGGVDLKAIDFKYFRSKTHPSLYLAGEVLNIDAVTGGFNFQAAWTGGWIAGQAMAEAAK